MTKRKMPKPAPHLAEKSWNENAAAHSDEHKTNANTKEQRQQNKKRSKMQPPQPQTAECCEKNAFGSNLTSALFTRSIYFIA